MEDKRLDIFKIFAVQICSWFEDKLTFDVKYSADGNNVEIWLHGYPLYPSKKLGNIIFVLPASYISVGSSQGVRFGKIGQAHIKFYQERIGKCFAHPHVWGSGEPCWNHIDKSNPVDLYCSLVHTLLLTNVTKNSLEIGKPCPDSAMRATTYALILDEAKKHQKIIKSKLKLPNDAFELGTLGMIFNNRLSASINIILR